MTGTILNAAAIIAGGLAGLAVTKQLSLVNQTALKILMGAFTVYVGLAMTWQGLNGSFVRVLKQLTIVLLALMLGNVTGKLLRIQRGLNHLGQYAKKKIAEQPKNSRNFNDGFIVCSLLFCVAPIAVLGAFFDGLTGNYQVLIVKAAMDGLAMLAFVAMFGWSAIVAVIPLVAYQGTISLAAKSLSPFLEKHGLLDSVNATGGMLVFCIALIILELKKIELADYVPSLVFAPAIAWLWR